MLPGIKWSRLLGNLSPFEASPSYAFSRGADGNMSFTTGDTSQTAQNRERFLGGLAIDHRALVLPRQVHGVRIAVAGREHRGRGALSAETALDGTDALVTKECGLPLGVQTADCLPVFVFDPRTPSAGIVHAGWRGTRERIAAKTVELMAKEFGADPRHMRCVFGPAIRQCCYEVGEDLAGFFPRSVIRDARGLRFDLCKENRLQLTEAGIPAENISDCRVCTCCNADLFSFRREGAACGRLLSVIMLA
jgi:polyphenol oxidase